MKVKFILIISVVIFSFLTVSAQTKKEILKADSIITVNGVTDTIYKLSSVDVEPRCKGGDKVFYKYFAKNFRYPAEARERHIMGMVEFQLVVEEDGSLSDIKVIKSVGFGIDEEALRVIRQSPKWLPGSIKGRPVRVLLATSLNVRLAG